ncbi:MAG: hypothetical protein RLZZ393_1417 [Pseudomonadota bacterium]
MTGDKEVAQQPQEEFVWPTINRVGADAPWRWLAAGWDDLRAAPGVGLFYGAVLAAMGQVLLGVVGGAVGVALTTGFLLVGPFLAIGLYDVSRRREAGERPRLGPTLFAWQANLPAISFYAVALALLLAAWIRISVVVIAVCFPEGQIDWLTPRSWVFAGAYLSVGAGLALFVFATTSLSLPLLLDRRDMDTISAAITSFNALRQNLRPMIHFGLTIVMLTSVGFMTWRLGLVIAMPLIGHMTWHAYREVIRA